MQRFNKKIKKTILISLLIALTSGFTGCGTPTVATGPAKLVIWGTFETTQNISQFISDYQSVHPSTEIEYKEKDFNTYESDLINALATGQGPDIFSIHNDWLPKYQDKLQEAPDTVFTLKDYIATYVDVAKNDFVANGKIYALPLSVDSLGLYYNKDILGTYGIATPPRTWEELRKDVKIITQQDASGFFRRSGVAMGTTANVNRAVDIAYLLMLQNRTVPYSADFSSATLDATIRDKSGNTFFPAANALTYYTSFANPNSDVYTWNARSNYSIDAFANGELAFMYGYSYTRDAINQKAPNLNYDVAPVPQPNLSDTAVNFANYFAVGVSKQSKFTNQAWDFIKFMGSKDELTSYYTRHKLPSSRRDIIAEQINDLDIGTFASANLTAQSFYKKDQQKVDAIISDAIDQMTLRNKSVTDILGTATQQINLLNY